MEAPDTSASLLQRLQRPDEHEAWRRFVHLYTPLLYDLARRRLRLQPSDAADLVSEVLAHLFEKLPAFRYDPHKSFRSWLGTVVHNKWCDLLRRRRDARLEVGDGKPVDLPQPDCTSALEEKEYHQYLLGRALQLLQSEFQENHWKACWEQLVHGRSAAEVAGELNITLNVALLAKSRGLRRLRQEMQGLLDEQP
jgi:RNA polymerase sigma-70 factor (ECF subfamily)